MLGLCGRFRRIGPRRGQRSPLLTNALICISKMVLRINSVNEVLYVTQCLFEAKSVNFYPEKVLLGDLSDQVFPGPLLNLG